MLGAWQAGVCNEFPHPSGLHRRASKQARDIPIPTEPIAVALDNMAVFPLCLLFTWLIQSRTQCQAGNWAVSRPEAETLIWFARWRRSGIVKTTLAETHSSVSRAVELLC